MGDGSHRYSGRSISLDRMTFQGDPRTGSPIAVPDSVPETMSETLPTGGVESDQRPGGLLPVRRRNQPGNLEFRSGGGGIRTPGDVAASAVFKTAPIDHSGTPPTGFASQSAVAVGGSLYPSKSRGSRVVRSRICRGCRRCRSRWPRRGRFRPAGAWRRCAGRSGRGSG